MGRSARTAFRIGGGIYTRPFNLTFDVDQTPEQLTTAKLTPEYEARLRDKIRLAAQGIEYDPDQRLQPSGFPAVAAHSLPA